MNNEIKIFEKEEFGSVRVVMRDGEPWFVAKDVAAALGYAKPANAIQQHCEKVNKITQVPETGTSQSTPPVNILIIPEEDVYALIFGSHLPAARKFRRWLCDEVLPSLRKTGRYEMPSESPAREIAFTEEINATVVVLKLAGVTGNQLAIAADNYFRNCTGRSALALSRTVIVSETQEQLLTPTEIGHELEKVFSESGETFSARRVNVLLKTHGFQKKRGDGKWEPTDKGLEVGGVLLDTGKKHGNGVPVCQLKWRTGVVEALKDVLLNTLFAI